MSQLSPNSVDANSVPRNAPGPRFSEAVFNGLLFWRDPIRVLEGATERYGDMVRVPIGRNQILHLIHQPEHTEHVLLKNNRNYQKSSPFGLLKMLFGRGLLFNEGESWFTQRRLMQPALRDGAG